MGEDRIARIRELDALITKTGNALVALKAERRQLGHEESLTQYPNLHGRRIRDAKGRVFELLMQFGTVSFRGDGTPVREQPKYKQIQIRKDGGRSQSGETYCFALDYAGNPNKGWSWVEEEHS